MSTQERQNLVEEIHSAMVDWLENKGFEHPDPAIMTNGSRYFYYKSAQKAPPKYKKATSIDSDFWGYKPSDDNDAYDKSVKAAKVVEKKGSSD